MEADRNGRPPLPIGKQDDHVRFDEIVKEIRNTPEAIEPLITGKDLINVGFVPGKELGDAKKALFNLQIENNYNKTQLLKILGNGFTST